MKNQVLKDIESLNASACQCCGVVRLSFGPVNVRLTTEAFQTFVQGLTQVSEQLRTPKASGHHWMLPLEKDVVA